MTAEEIKELNNLIGNIINKTGYKEPALIPKQEGPRLTEVSLDEVKDICNYLTIGENNDLFFWVAQEGLMAVISGLPNYKIYKLEI